MDINELPSLQFMVNEAGMVSVFMPAFEGEPSNPVITKKDDSTLHFQRSANGDVLLTKVEPEVMKALSGVKKMLVIEPNVLKSIDILDKALSAYIKPGEKAPADQEITDTIERAYEVAVNV